MIVNLIKAKFMITKPRVTGQLHTIPEDFEIALSSNLHLWALWKALPLLHVMNGYVGLNLPKSKSLDSVALKELLTTFLQENAVPVAGLDVLIVELFTVVA